MMISPRFPPVKWVCLIGLVTGVLVRAQQANTPAPVPTFKVNANAVVEDVVVTDRKGQPVLGLSQDDFTILENNRPQAIRFFEEHGVGKAAGGAKQPATASSPGVYTNAVTPDGDEPLDILLIDALNTQTGDQAKSHQQMIEHLRELPPNARIAVFTLGTELKMVQGFTSDSSSLLEALGRSPRLLNPSKSPLLETPGEKEARLRDRDDLLEEATPGGSKPAGLVAMAELALKNFEQRSANQAALSTDLRVRITLDAFMQIGRFVEGIPGRKNLIWLTGSFPISLFPNMDLKNPFQASRDYAPEIERVDALLSASRVAVFPVDARGLYAQPMYSAAASGGSMARTMEVMSKDEGAAFSQGAVEKITLDTVAKQTGGEAVYNTNNIKQALDAVHSHGRHYYTLVYTPPSSSTKQGYRRIDVKVKQGKYELEYRRSYIEERPGSHPVSVASARKLFMAEMNPGVPDTTEILFHVQAADEKLSELPGAPKGDNAKIKQPAARYRFTYSADPTTLRLTAEPNGSLHGLLTILTIAYDVSGRALNSTVASLNVHIPADSIDKYEKAGIRFAQELDIPAGDAYVRSGIFEEESQQIGTLGMRLTSANK